MIRKQRKPRGIKLNGKRSYDMCPTCYMPGCDPFAGSRKYRENVYKRLSQGKCPACNQFDCKCKSSILSDIMWEEREANRKNNL